MNNIMIDIETLGKKRGCPVLSIAAVQFDLQTGNIGETFYERMSCDAALSYGWPEISTLEWWDKQSDEARDAAFNGERHPVSVAAELRAFLQRAGGGRCIPWGNGSVFDITILEGWFDRVDPLVDAKGDDIYPWKFWDIADLRTLVRLSGIDAKAIPFAGEKHNALADALHQVKVAYMAYTQIELRKKPLLPLDDDLITILGRPNFSCARLAQGLRLLGHEIPRRSENEQAAVLHFLLGHYFVAGKQWREMAETELSQVANDG
uniref:3'-5' exonuclease n=1 Tax=Serratia proteamaculans TaxID=28151 RepID=UPI001F4C0A6F|nr:3'-5' exonuclease [Serratia proteamaculans]ULG15524.1 hypothetical protein 465p1_00119 [Serratia proteamaculans]